MLGANEIVIHDGNAHLYAAVDQVIDGERKARGLVPRDYTKYPVGYYPGETGMHAVEMPVIPRTEWSERIKAQIATKTRLSDFRMRGGPGGGMIPSRDQNGKGYCVVADTMVTMADGSRKAIQKIKAGESVISHTGAACEVIRPTSRQYYGQLFRIHAGPSTRTREDVVATADHPFWTPEGKWVEAQNLTRDRNIVYHGEPARVGDYIVQEDVEDVSVYCLQVEGDHSFIANGYAVHNCWRHSGTSAHLLIRARDETPYADLSPYAGACRIKHYVDEGGWGAQGLDDIMTFGDPTSEFWPQRATDRKYDTPATWANAKLHRITEGWIDMSAAQYDRRLSFEQEVTCHLLCIPTVNDYNWWSHSVCGTDVVDGVAQWGVTRADSGKLMDRIAFELFWGVNDPVTAGIAIRIWNSWSDTWSDSGMGLLSGSKAVADGCTAPRVATWTAA